jgi:hypothetical protein
VSRCDAVDGQILQSADPLAALRVEGLQVMLLEVAVHLYLVDRRHHLDGGWSPPASSSRGVAPSCAREVAGP